jgi:signal transduction histidine kinase
MSSLLVEIEPFRGNAGASVPSGASGHAAQLYEDEQLLCSAVADFLEPALRADGPVLVIATEAHRRDLAGELARRGFDLESGVQRGGVTVLDAGETLARVMRDGAPDRELFRASVGAAVRHCLDGRPQGTSLRVYGEMADLLWREDPPQAALELEEMWNELHGAFPFSLLCAYAVDSVVHGTLQELVRLRQRERALEAELHEREETESALREALAERRRAETALRGSEATLRLRNEELARAVHFSEMFVGILGHDLRNPLSGVTTAARLLARRADSEKVARPAARILSSAERMARMIDQLLDFTRVRLGQGIPLTRAPTDLAEICRLAIDEIEGGAHAPRVQLAVAGDPVGTWDGDRLAQLASNLIGNALAHGEPASDVRVRVDGRTEQVTLQIENAGVVPPDLLPMLFQPMRVGQDRKPARSSGLGLGLYISQQIALAHGGDIEVTSTDPDGTRMRVRLPRDPVVALSTRAAVRGGHSGDAG